MRKSKLVRELALLLLPALALGGIALWMQSSGDKQVARDHSGPFRLVVERIERQPLTPRDVAEGFDTRVQLTLNYTGPDEEAWGNSWLSWSNSGATLFEKRGGTRRFSNLRALEWGRDYELRNPEFDTDSQTYRAAYLFRMSPRVAHPRPILCETSISAYRLTKSSQVTLAEGTPFSFPLLRANEKATPPRNVSRACPLSVREVKVKTVASTPPTFDPGINVSAVLETHDVPDFPVETHTVGRPYLEDETGRRYKYQQGMSRQDMENGSFACNWWFNNTLLPRKARRLTFHTRLSLGETWPVTIRAVLWDKTKPTRA